MLDLIKVTPADVKIAMGLAISNTTWDEQIEAMIITRGPLILEDYFTVEEVINMTPNQRERAKIGLATYIAGEVMNTAATASGLGGGGGESLTIGPISLGGMSGSASASNILKVAASLTKTGADILDTLHLANASPAMIMWGAVGSRIRPTVIGGPKY